MWKPAAFVTATASLLVACLMSTPASAVGKRDKNATPKAETYSVVQVGDEMKVISKSALADLRKQLAKQYKDDMKQYKAAMKEAAKTKDKGADKAPEKPVQTKIVNLAKKTFKTEQEAKTWLENHADASKDQPKTDGKTATKTDKKPAAQ
jgi:hypothetical protein